MVHQFSGDAFIILLVAAKQYLLLAVKTLSLLLANTLRLIL